MQVWTVINPFADIDQRVSVFSSEERAQEYIDATHEIDNDTVTGPYVATMDEAPRKYICWHVYMGRDGAVVRSYQSVRYCEPVEEKGGAPWDTSVYGSAGTFERALELAQEKLEEIKEQEATLLRNPNVPEEDPHESYHCRQS